MLKLYSFILICVSLKSGKTEDCLIKEGYRLSLTTTRMRGSTQTSSAEACAQKCSENDDCTVFSHDQQNCSLYQYGEIRQRSEGVKSGICPKSQKTLEYEAIEDIPITVPNFQCSEEDPTQICHFPFMYKGKLQWDSVRDESGQCKCTIADMESATDKNSLTDHKSTDDLVNCTNCNSGACPVEGFHYSGFPLRNYNGKNDYRQVSLEECQTLCKSTHGCMFFNYDDSKVCWLKWGVGTKSVQKTSSEVFGHKNCPIDCKYSWGHWSGCSVTCGEGVEIRRTILEQPLFGGKECEVGAMEETRPCTYKLEECLGNANVVVGSLLPIVTFVLVVVGLVFFVKKRKASEGGSIDIKKIKHTVLKKDDLLNDKITALADNTSLLNEEFKTLESVVKENVDDTTVEAKLENNIAHNRYKDIVPYDGQFITLKEQAGDPPTNYINATLIKFDGIKQTFIATQAPKPNSFQNFWQMVIENKVKVIVMITGLVEGNKRKADQYWPDEENRVKDLMNGVKLDYKDTSFQGTYYHRTIQISLPNGTTSEVSQLQTTKWLDLTAPEDTNILLDLVNKTRELVDFQSDTPVVVHCSAGVGRTGTFIAVYKIIIDYLNQKVKVLDPFQTIFEMRQQRMKMVQKPPQYAYVVNCVTHVVKEEEGAYYEN